MNAVSSSYFESSTQAALKKALSRDGFLCLGAFSSSSLYAALSRETFVLDAVPNKFSYKRLLTHDYDFSSITAFLTLLLNRTTLHVSYDVLSFEAGHYTLLYDTLTKQSPRGVGFLFFTRSWEKQCGGNLIIKGDDEHFVISPLDGLFVYIHDVKTLAYFIQYVNLRAKRRHFYVVLCLVS